MTTHDQLSEANETGYITPDQPGGIPGWQEGIPVFRIYTCAQAFHHVQTRPLYA